MLLNEGDILWAELDGTRGTEQFGRRPALVLSNLDYHQMSSRALICPITTRAEPWPFNLPLPPGLRVGGVVLVDQVRSVDRAGRLFRRLDSVPTEFLVRVRQMLATFAGIGG
jgi:mRNA interferase MazF